MKLQPHLASCDWALITCRVKFHHWIKVREGATKDGRSRKSDKGGKWRVDDLKRSPAYFVPFNVALAALLAVIKISMNCWMCLETTYWGPTGCTNSAFGNPCRVINVTFCKCSA